VRVRQHEYAQCLFHSIESRTTNTTGTKIANHQFRCEPLRPLCEGLSL
jgi:hypothetical protein